MTPRRGSQILDVWEDFSRKNISECGRSQVMMMRNAKVLRDQQHRGQQGFVGEEIQMIILSILWGGFITLKQ
jgi:hypothetical protein